MVEQLKELGLALVRDGAIVLYLHLVARPLFVKQLALLEALVKKDNVSADELAAATKEAEKEVPEIPQGLTQLGVNVLKGGNSA
jgi:hypothetical protein